MSMDAPSSTLSMYAGTHCLSASREQPMPCSIFNGFFDHGYLEPTPDEPSPPPPPNRAKASWNACSGSQFESGRTPSPEFVPQFISTGKTHANLYDVSVPTTMVESSHTGCRCPYSLSTTVESSHPGVHAHTWHRPRSSPRIQGVDAHTRYRPRSSDVNTFRT